MILHVLKHELRLIFREPRFWIPFVIPPVLLAASQGIAVSRYGGQIMQGMEGYMMLLLGCLMAPMGAPLAADSFAGERERNSLELLQLSPVKPADLFWGKLLAVLPFPLIFSLFCQLVYFAVHMDSVSGCIAVAAILGSMSACLLVNAFSLLLSLKAKTVRAATQGTLFFIVPLLLLVQFGYQTFLQNLMVPVMTLVLSLAVCGVATVLGMRKFISL
ncbi:ABC transporter permease [Fibrobacter sp. UWEL]|uniref:ABC transporter permease n=1 Tax=Fibrobacter sp. UWEL TaxID=1896209 RepID=UPI0009247EB2|nr:ABC transporter permease [Fibrobacter sp. UWEL]SHK55793.1 ABC-2 type transporter [Fibrobacter sp. UWEL]